MNLRRACIALVGLILVTGVSFLLRSSNVHAQDKPKPPLEQAATEMAQAALAFYQSLTPDQQKKTQFDLKSDERTNWHFIPKPRNGLTMKDMTPKQRELAAAFLRSGLSDRGFKEATGIMNLEPVLKELEQGKGPVRDSEMYYFSVFGTPGPAETWGWRVEGHHLSINLVVVEGKEVAACPTFFGTNPARTREVRILAVEEDAARDLVKSLDEAAKKKAIFADVAPRDIITGNKKKVDALKPEGITFAELDKTRQEQLRKLVEHYATRYRKELADSDLRRISDAGWDKVAFAWAGGLEEGQGHYYRIQGPTFLIEYDNTQNNANHIHSAWRDFKNDFGEDILRKHYEQHAKDAGHGH